MEIEKNTVGTEIELTNMVMIQNKENGKVLIQERVKSWTGISFPGGHVEPGEGFVQSAVREVKEETGLDVSNLQPCGVIHWVHTEKLNRHIVLLYKTTDFSGQLLNETEEGRVFWISPDELKNCKLSNNFDKYLPMFFDEGKIEAYGEWNETDPDKLVYF